MDRKECRHLLESLSEYVDGSLDDTLCLEIERHMQGCENCRIVVDTLRKTIYLYHATAASPEVPADVRARLYRRLNLSQLLENRGSTGEGRSEHR